MVSDSIHIALVANDRYRPGLASTRRSMTDAAAHPDRLVFHEFGEADMTPFLPRFPLADYNGSKLPYLRLFLPELLPACDWVIYADVDTLWFRDPEELWNERDETKSVCWVADVPSTQQSFAKWAVSKDLDVKIAGAYACSGVVLVNLRKWRETSFTARAIEFFKRYGCPPYPDQDMMNVLFAQDAKMLPAEWNCIIPPVPWRPCVVHLVGVGLRFGSDRYEGSTPAYLFWFDYYREKILHLPRYVPTSAVRIRLALLSSLQTLLGAFLAFLYRLPLPFAVQYQVVRLRRQLNWAKIVVRRRA